ncbi:MAG: ABC transporter substrate-binding protein [Lachnospiraceae bacterium]|nr:ABC transporter substrate-binding protein [Lachnospiraceae bacterium]
MKKKVLSLMLSSMMVAGVLAGCGEGAANTAQQAAGDAAATVTEAAQDAADTVAEAAQDVADTAADAVEEVADAAEAAADEGKVLNIYCWNEEFKSRITDHYPGYAETDATHGTIGDVNVVWNITPSTDNAYQNALDAALLAQEGAAADDKVDLFLVEADYALKYVDTPYAMPVADLGITDAELANQYQYTKDVMTDSQGVLKGLSWQGCPGVLIYNREAAKAVLGSDDPAEVQNAVKDWAAWNDTAKKMKDAGYYMVATSNDSYRVYSNNVTSKWVVDGKINIDKNIEKWVEDTKALVDAKEASSTGNLWGDEWNAGFYPDGKVFCYFGPAWMINFSMKADDPASIGGQGGWGATEGPQGFFWGGTWICAATGTDNATLVADIMRQMTTNEELMLGIVKKDNDFVNNKPAMEKAATDDSFAFAPLGGQNPLAIFAAGATKIDLSNQSAYDQGCNEEFQNAMKNYFDGNATYEEALDLFYKGVEEKYPELTH